MSEYTTSEEARKDGNKLFVERDFVKGRSASTSAIF